MSKKIKLQDLSISKFDQQINVEGVKGGFLFIRWDGCYSACRPGVGYSCPAVCVPFRESWQAQMLRDWLKK